MIKNWNGKRVLILGAARQGLALARFLAQHGAVVTLNDQASPESSSMKSAIQSLSSFPDSGSGSIRWVLGEHPLSLLENLDLLCISGGVPLTMPIVEEAIKNNIPLSNDTQIFMEHVPCPVIGITGSAGKTTTTSLTGQLFESLAKYAHWRKVWVGGNIGIPLIDQVEDIEADDIVILEMSSFQLELMTISPHISAILNITPNHLDRHGTLEAYTEAKSHILSHQGSQDITVLCRDDNGSWALNSRVQGVLFSYGMQIPSSAWRGCYVENNMLTYHDQNTNQPIVKVSDIPLRGSHNILNTMAACTIAATVFAKGNIGFDEDMISDMGNVIRHFKGVPHRLELVKQNNGISWYNDSIATSPERTIAAIQSYDEPIVLLLGGHDKNLPWHKLARLVVKRIDHVITFGEAADLINSQIREIIDQENNTGSHRKSAKVTLASCSGLQEAVGVAARTAQPGDVVLLSPGAASYDEFKDFEERGNFYTQWVQELSI